MKPEPRKLYAWSLPSISVGYNVEQEFEDSALRGIKSKQYDKMPQGCHHDLEVKIR